MDDIILKYLKGEMDIDDQHRLSKWIAEDPKNKKTLQKIELFWKSGNQSTQAAKSKVWIRLMQEIEEGNTIQEAVPEKTRSISWYAVAAAVALFIASTFVILNLVKDKAPRAMQALTYTEKVCPPGEKMPIQLADGTVVQLNSGSSIKYPLEFVNDKREIILSGEAFFDVARDESKPFIIHTPEMDVEVLGTSFNIQAYEEEPASEVAVRHGRVRVMNHAGQSVELTKSEQAVLNKNDDKLAASELQNADAAFGWMEGRLVFEDEDLETALRKVSRWYGVSIQHNLKFTKKKITSNCKDCTIKEIMESLSYSYDFKYEINGTSIAVTE